MTTTEIIKKARELCEKIESGGISVSAFIAQSCSLILVLCDKVERQDKEISSREEESFETYGRARAAEREAKDLKRQLEQLQNAQRWIPVSKKFPDVKGEYLVVYHPCHWDVVEKEIRVGVDTFKGKTAWANKKYQRVTHWQHLPQPPKGE